MNVADAAEMVGSCPTDVLDMLVQRVECCTQVSDVG